GEHYRTSLRDAIPISRTGPGSRPRAKRVGQRGRTELRGCGAAAVDRARRASPRTGPLRVVAGTSAGDRRGAGRLAGRGGRSSTRSEEHTSELQSRENL